MLTTSTVTVVVGLCFIVLVLAMGLFSNSNKFEVEGRTAIVTGGSQGLGLALATLLSKKGAHVVIVAQNEPKLEKACEQIRAAARNSQQRFRWLSYDLKSSESAPLIVKDVTSWNGGDAPDIVINCAGHCKPGFLASSRIETLRDQMDTLYWTCTYMAHATLNSWIEFVPKAKQLNKTRHLVFTSSVLAFMPLAGYAPYNPAKAAMRSLADTLNQEVQVYNGIRRHESDPGPATDIKIHAIYPMGILSPGFENEQKLKPALTHKLEEDDKPQQPDELGAVILQELEAGKYVVTCSLIGHIMKGWAMGGSQRVGIMDYIWNWLGTLVVLFVVPDFMSKCFKWGQQKGTKGLS